MSRLCSGADDEIVLNGGGGITGLPTAGWGGALTFACWVRATTLVQSGRYIFNSKGAFHTEQHWGVTFSGGSVAFYVSNDAAPGVGSGITLPDTDWHHIAYRRGGSGSNTWDKFLDGAKTSIDASINFALPAEAHTRISAFNYSFPNVLANSEFRGNLGDLVVERRAFSDGDIAYLAALHSYAELNPAIDADLCLVYWRMCNDGNNELVLDYSGNNRHGSAYFTSVLPTGDESPGGSVETGCPNEAEPEEPSGCASYKVYADWDGDGDFSDPDEDITADVYSAKWEYGRDRWSQLTGRSIASKCEIELLNVEGKYSSWNEDSPLFGLPLLGLKVQIKMKIGDGSYVTMYTGYLQSIQPSIKNIKTKARATLQAEGVLTQLGERKFQLAMQTHITTGSAIAAVLDAINFSPDERTLDTGKTTLQRVFFDTDKTALEAIREIEDTEAGWICEGKNGKLKFQDRGHRFENSRSTTVQATWTNDPAGTIRYSRFKQEDELKEIYNDVTAEVRNFNLGEEDILVSVIDIDDDDGNSRAPILLLAGESIEMEILFPPDNPEGSPASVAGVAVHEWTQLDVEANSEDDGSGTDYTTNISISPEPFGAKYSNSLKFTLTNNGSYGQDAYIIVLRAHGIPIVEGSPIKINRDDDDSILKHGARVYPFPGKWIQSIEEAVAFCDYFLDLYKTRRPALTPELTALRCSGNTLANLVEIQTRDLSDRIAVVADKDRSTIGIDEEFFVEHLKHEVSQGMSVHTMEALCSKVAGTEWPAMDIDYDETIVTGAIKRVPDLIFVRAFANGLKIHCGVEALKYNHGIFEGEIRAQYYAAGTEPGEVDMRTIEEGGTWVPNGTTSLLFDGLGADNNGTNLTFTSGSQGVWFIAGRLRNPKGWSVWSDGNTKPRHVKFKISTEDPAFADVGPPEDWEVILERGPIEGTAVVKATRPKINGNHILFVLFQIKDVSTGSWRYIDENAGAASTIYDGSAISHTYNKLQGTLHKDSGGNYPAISYGDLILFDVRGSAFSRRWCQWATVPSEPVGATLRGLFAFRPDFDPTANEYADVRIKVVRPVTQWNSEGYLGDEPNHGLFERQYYQLFPAGDTSTAVFVSDPITLPAGLDIEDVEARAWFENALCRDDNDKTHSTGVSNTSGVDTVPPGKLVDLTVIGGRGRFTWNFKDPETGNKTLVKVVEQWSEDSDFYSAETALFDYDNRKEGTARNKAYYFRFLAQNQSGVNDSSLDQTTIDFLNSLGSQFTDGWGPWTNANMDYEPPTLIQSGPAYAYPDADTITIDLSKGTYFAFECDDARGDREIVFDWGDEGPIDKYGFIIEVKQSYTGGNTWTLPANIAYSDDNPDATLSTEGTKTDQWAFVYDLATDTFILSGRNKGILF